MKDEIKEEQKTEQKNVFIRTIIKESVHERLKEFSKRYSTGRGDWDFGVGIEILLDWYESSQLSSINDKMDLLLKMLNSGKEPEKEEAYEEFLGGHKEKVS